MMDEANSIETIEDMPYKALHFEWIAPLWIHPFRTLKEISKQEKAVWLVPLLLLTLLALLNVLASGPARANAVQVASPPAENMQFYTPEQVSQFEQAANQSRGPLFIYFFPAIQVVLGIWFSWFLLGSLLHFALTLSGSRSQHVMTLNILAWASLPLGLRYLVQAVYSLVSHHVILAQGLSGFLPPSGGANILMNALLAQMDIYGIWQVGLLLVGVSLIARLARGKAWIATLATLFIVMCLSIIPTLISSQMSELSGGGVIPFF